jgi:modulator of FtsH protease HflC
MRVFLLIFVAAVLLLAASMSCFTVDPTEYVYLTQFGRPVATYDGADRDGGGLHVKWPWPMQSVQRLDRRLQELDLPASQLLTRDSGDKTIDKTLTVSAYLCWRIADRDSVDRFIRRVGTPDQARTLLIQRINSQLGAIIGQMQMTELIHEDPGIVTAGMERVRHDLLQAFGEPVRRDYGIEIVDVRLRRFNYPVEVRDSIFERIRSERRNLVARYRSEGEVESSRIENEAKRDKEIKIAEAHAKEIELKGKADAEADRIRNVAQSKDPQFYEFLKKLEAYQLMFGDGKTVLLLSTHRDLLDELFKAPHLNSGSPGASPAGTQTASPKSSGKSGGD